MRLSDLFDDEAKKYITDIDDYRIRLISAIDMPDDEFGKFATELGDVMQLVKHQGKDLDKLIEKTNHKIYSPEAADFLKVAANVDLDFEVKDGGVDMCEALERKYKEKEVSGAIETYREFGISDDDIVMRIVERYNVTKEYVMALLTPQAVA